MNWPNSGPILTEPQHGELAWDGKINSDKIENTPTIATYHDHRMALAFAPIAITGTRLKIDDPGVVTKSYPGFWEDLKQIGFKIEKDTSA